MTPATQDCALATAADVEAGEPDPDQTNLDDFKQDDEDFYDDQDDEVEDEQ